MLLVTFRRRSFRLFISIANLWILPRRYSIIDPGCTVFGPIGIIIYPNWSEHASIPIITIIVVIILTLFLNIILATCREES